MRWWAVLGPIALGLVALAMMLEVRQSSAARAAAVETEYIPVCGNVASGPNCQFLAAVLGSLEDEWRPVVEQRRLRSFAGEGDGVFNVPTLVIFSGMVTSGCGDASRQLGPFYCTDDRSFYVDPVWFAETDEHAPGDFGQALIVAHEYAHWLQDESGIGPYVRRQRALRPARASELTVRFELQADCLAGVWGGMARERLRITPEDVSEGIGVANYLGNDVARLRQGLIADPSTFTHGSSEQRARWVMRGFESADPAACDTFAVPYDQL